MLSQEWHDLAFVHWAVEPSAVAGVTPRGTVPDTHDGLAYVGLVAFRMHRAGWLRLPGIPCFGSFPETNVRLYSVDAHGRRGVVFRPVDAARLRPVVMGRVGSRVALPSSAGSSWPASGPGSDLSGPRASTLSVRVVYVLRGGDAGRPGGAVSPVRLRPEGTGGSAGPSRATDGCGHRRRAGRGTGARGASNEHLPENQGKNGQAGLTGATALPGGDGYVLPT